MFQYFVSEKTEHPVAQKQLNTKWFVLAEATVSNTFINVTEKAISFYCCGQPAPEQTLVNLFIYN